MYKAPARYPLHVYTINKYTRGPAGNLHGPAAYLYGSWKLHSPQTGQKPSCKLQAANNLE